MSSSAETTQLVTPGDAAPTFLARNLLPSLLSCVFWFFVCPTLALAQDRSPQTPAPGPASQSASNQNSAELTSHDEPTIFKVNTKLVVVRAVVRDSQGHAIGNLHQEDFQIFDKGKPQVIAQFEVEQPGNLSAKVGQVSGSNPAPPLAPPTRFVAYLFDDVHLEFGDLARVREAAERHFSTLRPTDRAAIFTTSGMTVLDYTDDRAKLHETLLRLQPRPIMGNSMHDCPDISYYQADLIVNKLDTDATLVANQEAAECGTINVQGAAIGNSSALVESASRSVLGKGDQESRMSLGSLKQVVQNAARMPGQRSIILVSPGFIMPGLEYEYYELVDRAVRSQVVISTLDARGLYVILPYGDASRQPASVPGDSMGANTPPVSKTLMQAAAASANDVLLSSLADNTGGIYFHNNNDFNEGFRRVAETPEYSYVLAFAPQNLKLDGSFHTLKVTLKDQPKFTLQARRGYYAPKSSTDPNEQAKQEIEDEMYSQEELHNLPVNLHTQFFKASDEDAKLVVLAHVDVKRLHFRKVEGRNENVLTCVSVLFNRNGNFVQGMQKTVTMHLKDETLEHMASGITLKTSFDVKPGDYLVRLVVRDAEGQLMSAENGAVEIQ